MDEIIDQFLPYVFVILWGLFQLFRRKLQGGRDVPEESWEDESQHEQPAPAPARAPVYEEPPAPAPAVAPARVQAPRPNQRKSFAPDRAFERRTAGKTVLATRYQSRRSEALSQPRAAEPVAMAQELTPEVAPAPFSERAFHHALADSVVLSVALAPRRSA